MIPAARSAAMPAVDRSPPLVVHVIHRLGVGGLENGVVNLLNHMPADRYRHAVVSLAEHCPKFAERIRRQDVALYSLAKRPGQDWGCYLRLWRLLRRLRPEIVHTRNLGTLDLAIIAWLAGVPHRVHGEHGWDMVDLHGTHPRYRRLRRLCRHFVQRYVPMSSHLARWIADSVGVDPGAIRHVYNGVDTQRFQPGTDRSPLPWRGTDRDDWVVIGTVGRLEHVKDPMTLLQAFLALVRAEGEARRRLRLVFVGDGVLRPTLEAAIDAAGASDIVWLAGSREDVPRLMRALDVFVLPSLNEGMSNTILEAMASGLPVVATRVGGNPEVVEEGVTGLLCDAGSAESLTAQIARYVREPTLRSAHGSAGRRRVLAQFSLQSMVGGYLRLYDELIATDRSGS